MVRTSNVAGSRGSGRGIRAWHLAALLLLAALAPATAVAQRVPQPIFTELFPYDPTEPSQLLGEVADLQSTRQQAAAPARRRSDTAAAECYVALPAGADTRAQRALFHYRQNGTRTSEGAAPDLGGTSPALLPRQGLALGAKPGQSYAPRVNKMSVALTIALALASLRTRLGGRIVDAVSTHSGCCLMPRATG